MRTAAFRTLLGLLAVALAACGGGGQPQPDLSLVGLSPQNPTVAQGGSVDLTLTFASQNGFQGLVTLSVTENGQNPTWLTLSPTSKSLNVPKGGQVQENLQVSVAPNAPAGPHTLRLRATYGGRTAEVDLTLTVTAEPGTIWTVRHDGLGVCRVAYGDGTFVAAGVGLTNIFVSQDRGQTWTLKPRPISENLRDVTYGGGTFVVAVDSGWVVTSTDRGQTWTLRDTGVLHDIRGITYGDLTFVALGQFGHLGGILTSSDAVTWTQRTSWAGKWLWSVAYGGGTIVAVGDGGAILTSPDGGQTWTWVTSGTNDRLLRVTYGNGLFVAVGEGGTILTSSDGVSWTQRTTDKRLEDVTYGNGLFVAVGKNGTILTSRDGVTWRQEESGTDAKLCGVTYGDGVFLVVGDVVLTSP